MILWTFFLQRALKSECRKKQILRRAFCPDTLISNFAFIFKSLKTFQESLVWNWIVLLSNLVNASEDLTNSTHTQKISPPRSDIGAKRVNCYKRHTYESPNLFTRLYNCILCRYTNKSKSHIKCIKRSSKFMKKIFQTEIPSHANQLGVDLESGLSRRTV